MKIGIYEKAINKKFNWQEKIDIAKSAGFDFIELSIDETDEKINRLYWTENEIKDLKIILEKNNFYFNSICLSAHRKYPFGSKNEQTRRKAIEIMYKAIDLAVKLNVRIIQLAGYDVYYEESNFETRKNFIKGLELAVKYAQEKSIMLAFEIMDTEFMGTIEKTMQYIEIINNPWLQIYPDIGNLSQFSLSPEYEIKKYYNHIVAYHFKDTCENKFRDLNFGEGNVNFVEIIKAILATNFNGPILLEMWSRNDINETLEDNISKIKNAKIYIHQKFIEAIKGKTNG